jgi:N-acetylglucosamine-6-phosphate deacetylase
VSTEEATRITATNFFDGDSLRQSIRVTIASGIIVAIEPWDGPCDYHLVSPGLVDLQMNGWGSLSVAQLDKERISALDAELLSLGTTHWLATLVTDHLDTMNRRIAAIEASSERAPGCLGVHLEGPFLGSRHGAHDTRKVIAPDLGWLGDMPAVVRLVTLGAEHPDAPAAITTLRKRGVTVSLGHTAPSRVQWETAVRSGAGMVTHLFNAMSGVHHRDAAMALSALLDDRVMCGLISDMEHVSAEAVTLAFRAAGNRICLVSDSVAWSNPNLGAADTGRAGVAPRLADGTLAGSATPLATCIRRAVQRCGVGLEDALRAATSNPASVLGLDGIGRSTEGAPAVLVAFDADLRVVNVVRGLQSVRGNSVD